MKFTLIAAIVASTSALTLNKAPAQAEGVGQWRVHEYPPGPYDDMPKDPHTRKAVEDMYEQMKYRNQPSIFHHADVQLGDVVDAMPPMTTAEAAKPRDPVLYHPFVNLPYPTAPQGALPLTNPHFGNGDNVAHA